MIKWKLELMFGGEIAPVEVVAETACFVTVREKHFFIGSGPDKYVERRLKKDGTIFDTFADAKAALVEDAPSNVK